jgi:signal peptide peptidase SppA
MTHVARIASLIFNRPLLVLPDTAITIANALADRFDTELVDETFFEASRFRGKPTGPLRPDGSRENYYRVEDGVAIIQVMGELVNRGAWVGASSGLTSYEGLDAQLRAAAADDQIKGIVLDLNSPGGQASGAMETGMLVNSIGEKKPVVAFINGMAASAAYAIASGASHIVTTPSGISGSIGVVLLHIDRSAALAKAGVKPTLIYAGAHKVDGASIMALPEDARARLQAEVDEIYDLFVKTVATHRGLTQKAVRATEAGIFQGKSAVEAGLADQVGTLDDALAFVTKSQKPPPAANDPFGGLAMADNTNTVPKSEHEAALAAATKSGNDAAAAAAKVAAGAERTRTQAIIGAKEAEGRKDLAHHLAFSTDMAAEAAIALLAKAPAESAPSTAHKPRLEVLNPDVKPNEERKPADAAPSASWADVATQLNRESEMHRGGKRATA